MKTKLLSLFVLLFVAASVNSQVFIENFDYPAGDTIGSHGWTAFSGTTNNIPVKSPGLVYTNYAQSGIGNCATMYRSSLDYYKNFTGSDISSGSVYMSYMVKVDSAAGTGDYFTALLPQSSTTNYFARLFAKDTLGGLTFGISKSSISASNLPAWGTPGGLSYGTTYLLVVKYTFNTGTNTDDEVSLFVFTSPNVPAVEPVTPYAGPVTTTQTDAAGLGRVALRQGSFALAAILDIDGIWANIAWPFTGSAIYPVSTIAESFNLSQNYPNPFNPTTTINFSIPKTGFVTLKVYDINGREVKNLVSENMNAGKYEVNANFSELNSGVYFYKLNVTGDASFSDTKKLMLVK